MDIQNFFELTDPAPVCCGTGLVALDIVYPNKETVFPDLYAGGSCGNVLTILAYLGWISYPFAKLKNNLFSEILTRDFQMWNVKTDFISISEHGSTPIIIERISRNSNDELFHTFSMTCPSCGSTLPRYKPVLAKEINLIRDRLPKPFIFYLDRASKGSVLLAQEFKNRGALVFFEPPRIKDKRMFRECMMLADIIKYADTIKEDDSKILKEVDIPLVVKTMGSRGIEYSYRSDPLEEVNMHHMHAFPIKCCVDAAGAGDWCSAGIIHALMKHKVDSLNHISDTTLSEVLAFGQALAALNCHYYGARGSMYYLTLKNLESMIKKLLNGDEYETPKKRINPVYLTPETGSLCPNCQEQLDIS